jgi:hypothetical protein
MDEEQSSGQVDEETSSNAVIRDLSKAGLLCANGKATDKDENRGRCLKESLGEYLIPMNVLKKLSLRIAQQGHVNRTGSKWLSVTAWLEVLAKGWSRLPFLCPEQALSAYAQRQDSPLIHSYPVSSHRASLLPRVIIQHDYSTVAVR